MPDGLLADRPSIEEVEPDAPSEPRGTARDDPPSPLERPLPLRSRPCSRSARFGRTGTFTYSKDDEGLDGAPEEGAPNELDPDEPGSTLLDPLLEPLDEGLELELEAPDDRSTADPVAGPRLSGSDRSR